MALSSSLGGDHHFDEQLGDLGGGLLVERAVGGDDAAEGRDGIAGERAEIGYLQRLALRHAAGVGVLDNGDGRAAGEFAGQFEGGIGVVEIVEAQLLALNLLRRGEAGTRIAPVGVEGGGLMRVLAVAQLLLQFAGEHRARRIIDAVLLGEPGGDRRVIGAGAGIGLSSELAAERQRGLALVGGHLGLHDGIVRRVGQHRDPGMILRGPAD